MASQWEDSVSSEQHQKLETLPQKRTNRKERRKREEKEKKAKKKEEEEEEEEEKEKKNKEVVVVEKELEKEMTRKDTIPTISGLHHRSPTFARLVFSSMMCQKSTSAEMLSFCIYMPSKTRRASHQQKSYSVRNLFHS